MTIIIITIGYIERNGEQITQREEKKERRSLVNVPVSQFSGSVELQPPVAAHLTVSRLPLKHART